MIKKSNSSEGDGLMNTIIGKDTVFNGTLEVKGDLRVDGTVKGKIICTSCVTVGATGLVEAEIEAASAVVAGRMHGNIATSEKVELQAKCEMEGDLRTKSLVIEQGAIFCGGCSMKETKSDLGFTPRPNEQPALDRNNDKELASVKKRF